MFAKAELERRLAYLDLTTEDQRYLTQLEPLLRQHSDSLVAAFYRHLLSFAPTRELLRDPAVKERLVVAQRRYLISLARPALDEEYAAERLRIGETHMRIGLEPRWYLGAYALYFSLLAPLVIDFTRGDALATERTLSALLKVLMLDAQLAMEAYIQGREENLEYLNRELAESSRKLSHDYREQIHELRETTHRAEAAEQLASIATLVAGLAHEIGTPMGVIRGHAELLESAAQDERSRWRAGVIREQVDRISGIIQTLLNIARPREPVRTEVALDRLVEQILGFMGEKLRRRGIETTCELEPVPVIYGDPERLQQLCLNLFLNAADAMSESGKLSVRLRPLGEGEIELRIADTGVGIPAEHIGRIFEPFFTTKAAGAGNGLGLVVAKSIVLDHGGTIEVTSKLGKGSEFRITLPQSGPQSDAPSNSGA